MQTVSFTDAMRGGQQTFTIDTGKAAVISTDGASTVVSGQYSFLNNLGQGGFVNAVAAATRTALAEVSLELLLVTALTTDATSVGYLGEVTVDGLPPAAVVHALVRLMAQLGEFATDVTGDFGGLAGMAADGVSQVSNLIEVALATAGLGEAGVMAPTVRNLTGLVRNVAQGVADVSTSLAAEFWIRVQGNGRAANPAGSDAAPPQLRQQPQQQEEEISYEQAAALLSVSPTLRAKEPALDAAAIAALFAAGGFYANLAFDAKAKVKARSRLAVLRRTKVGASADGE